MKPKLILFFLSLMVLCSCASTIKPLHLKLQSHATFSNAANSQKFSQKAIIIADDRFRQNMPLYWEVWDWFFKAGLASMFEETALVENIAASGTNSENVIILQPELRSWALTHFDENKESLGLFDKPIKHANWRCRLGFKFKILDFNGEEKDSIIIETNSSAESEDKSIARAMSETITELRKLLTQKIHFD